MLKVVNHVIKLIDNSDDPWRLNTLPSEQKKYNFSIKKIVFSGNIFSPSRVWSGVRFIFNTKIIPLLPKIIKDILLALTSSHKSVESRFFAKTSYELMRMKIDAFVSKLTIYTIPKNLRPRFLELYNLGTFSLDLGDMSEFNNVLLRCFDDKQLKYQNRDSIYYEYSIEDSNLITKLVNKKLDGLLNFYFMAVSGYYVSGKLLYNLSITEQGNVKNCEMHQDTWASMGKGFIYLTDLTNNSPFEYLENSHNDIELRSNIVNSTVLSESSKTNRSIRVYGKDLNHCLSKFKLITYIAKSGTIIFANTSGYHRIGHHYSESPRIMLTFSYQRRGFLSKLFINLFAILLTKLRLI